MAGRIPGMAGRAIRATSRIVFVICGAGSLFTALPFALLRGVDLPAQSDWIIFVVPLGIVGLLSVAAGAAPRSWIAKACKRDRDDPRLFSFPLKVLGGFAAVFYLVAVFAHSVPNRWNLDPGLMFPLCPLYFLKMTYDPQPLEIFFILAPLNAAVYGALGLTLAYARLAFGKQTTVDRSSVSR